MVWVQATAPVDPESASVNEKDVRFSGSRHSAISLSVFAAGAGGGGGSVGGGGGGGGTEGSGHGAGDVSGGGGGGSSGGGGGGGGIGSGTPGAKKKQSVWSSGGALRDRVTLVSLLFV